MHFWSIRTRHHVGMRRRLGERYQLLHPVWRDRLGETFVARDRETGSPVAVRTLRGDLATGTVAHRFTTERARLVGIRGTHLAGVSDLVVDRDVLAVVSEIVTGQTLRQRLRTGRPTPREAARIGAEVAEGLLVLHDAGLLHRNLSRDSVIVSADGRIRVADFALAHLVAGVPAAPSLAKPAPELRAGSAPTAAVDVFGLGVLLRELTGHRLTAPLRQLARRLLARDPQARPSTRQAWVLLHSIQSVPPGDRAIPVSAQRS